MQWLLEFSRTQQTKFHGQFSHPKTERTKIEDAFTQQITMKKIEIGHQPIH